jgi:Ca2+-binding EF-hand superfamily protein
MKLRAIMAAGAVMTIALSPAFAASALTAADTDKDGTIDLAEAQAAAGASFDKLDVGHAGTLERKDLKGRVSDKDWMAADPLNDTTMTKDEYVGFVKIIFKRVDRDNDGTIDAKELQTPAGRDLLRLMK